MSEHADAEFPVTVDGLRDEGGLTPIKREDIPKTKQLHIDIPMEDYLKLKVLLPEDMPLAFPLRRLIKSFIETLSRDRASDVQPLNNPMDDAAALAIEKTKKMGI